MKNEQLKPLRAAIIGAGFIAEFHADAYLHAGDAELAAVCDADAEKARLLAERMHCRWYASAEEMLQAEQPDLVSVCVPTYLHEEMTVLALRYGAHVLCEKPMALTMAACEHMAAAAKDAGRMLMIAQVLRWWPEYRTIAENIRDLGTPYFCAVQRLQHASRTTWLANPELGGGVLFDLLVHDLDYVCSLFGYDPQIESVTGMQGKEGSWRSLCAVLRWPCGTAVKIESSNMMPKGFPFTASFRADYADACLDYRFNAPVNIRKDAKTATVFRRFDAGGVTELPYPDHAQSMAFDSEVAAFVDGVRTGVCPLPAGDTLRVMALIHRLKERLEQA